MNNLELAKMLADLAELLEFKRENPFKLRAYQDASRALQNLSEDIRFGVATAQRGWIEAKEVLNAMPLKALTTWMGKRGR